MVVMAAAITTDDRAVVVGVTALGWRVRGGVFVAAVDRELGRCGLWRCSRYRHAFVGAPLRRATAEELAYGLPLVPAALAALGAGARRPG